MPRKAYIINFDKGGLFDNFDYEKFHTDLTNAKGVINWWHYLKSSYLIITESNATATSITNFVMKKMPQKYFVVFEVNLQNHNGWLPKEAWEWIEKYK